MSRNSHSTKRVVPKIMWKCSHFPNTFRPTNCCGDKFMKKHQKLWKWIEGHDQFLYFVRTAVYQLGFYYYTHTHVRTYGHTSISTVMHVVRKMTAVHWQKDCLCSSVASKREKLLVCVCVCVFCPLFIRSQDTVGVARKAWVNTPFWFVY